MFSQAQAKAVLQQLLLQEQGGKTFLHAFSKGEPQATWAVGIANESDHEDFAVFAKFALQKISAADAYCLMLPLEQEGSYGYHVEYTKAGDCWCAKFWIHSSEWTQHKQNAAPLIEDLLLPGRSLPGVMRRDFEKLSEKLKIKSLR